VPRLWWGLKSPWNLHSKGSTRGPYAPIPSEGDGVPLLRKDSPGTAGGDYSLQAARTELPL